jgi:hypothetical protein
MKHHFVYDLHVISEEYLSILKEMKESGERLPDPDKQPYYALNGIRLPVQFLTCADVQLRKDFQRQTGIKVNKHILIKCPSFTKWGLELKKGPISSMKQSFLIDEHSTLVNVLWKSKSGRIYELTDTDIDCNDIDIWFDGLDIDFIYKYLFPKIELPFDLPELSYDLKITRLGLDIEVKMKLHQGVITEINKLVELLDAHINNFNVQSEKYKRKDGVVHNWKHILQGDSLTYQIDMGSAGHLFFRGLLVYISDLGTFEKVLVS